jgi:hypothetical protein
VTKQEFINKVEKIDKPSIIITVVLLPTGAKEVIVNHEFITQKIEYILEAYDDDLRLLKCKDIRILELIIL